MNGLKPEMLAAFPAIIAAFKETAKREPTLTSVCDGKHGPKSRHKVGYASDWRTHDLPRERAEELQRNLQARLGAEYDVVLEATHLHVEYDPK